MFQFFTYSHHYKRKDNYNLGMKKSAVFSISTLVCFAEDRTFILWLMILPLWHPTYLRLRLWYEWVWDCVDDISSPAPLFLSPPALWSHLVIKQKHGLIPLLSHPLPAPKTMWHPHFSGLVLPWTLWSIYFVHLSCYSQHSISAYLFNIKWLCHIVLFLI